MQAIVAEHGWPGHSLVGTDDAFAAWLLVQHADADRAFQEQCLALMQAAVAGEAEPAALVRATWLAHPAWMTALARLHQLPREVFAGLQAPYRPRWGDALIDDALALIAPPHRPQLRTRLATLGEELDQLQRQGRPISGDPNPANWGLRADGAAVLYDWERAGFGPPAFDLAITIPGLADAAAARQVVFVKRIVDHLIGETLTSTSLR